MYAMVDVFLKKGGPLKVFFQTRLFKTSIRDVVFWSRLLKIGLYLALKHFIHYFHLIFIRPSRLKRFMEPSRLIKTVYRNFKAALVAQIQDYGLTFGGGKSGSLVHYQAFDLFFSHKANHSLASSFFPFHNDISATIIVPVYNPKTKFLADLCESIKRQFVGLSGTEVIFIDDCSERDPSEKIHQLVSGEFAYRIFKNEVNKGISYSQNVGLKNAQSELILLLDHDDMLSPNALAWLKTYAYFYPRCKVFYTDESVISETGLLLSTWQKGAFNRVESLFHNNIHHLFAFRKSVLEEVGFFDSFYDGAQDFEFNLRCLEQLSDQEIMHIPHSCYLWRSHKSSTASAGTQKSYVANSLREALDRNVRLIDINVEMVQPDAAKRNGWSLLQPVWRPSVEKYKSCSVIIPTRNDVVNLRSCLASILQSQDPTVSEVIIIDDQSDIIDVFEFYKDLLFVDLLLIFPFRR